MPHAIGRHCCGRSRSVAQRRPGDVCECVCACVSVCECVCACVSVCACVCVCGGGYLGAMGHKAVDEGVAVAEECIQLGGGLKGRGFSRGPKLLPLHGNRAAAGASHALGLRGDLSETDNFTATCTRCSSAFHAVLEKEDGLLH